jgi:hypothetical protein
MDRQQILDLYEWAAGICFRHPAKGEVRITVIGFIHPRCGGERKVLGCEDCVIDMEDARRETAAHTGGEYEPGHLGECPG